MCALWRQWANIFYIWHYEEEERIYKQIWDDITINKPALESMLLKTEDQSTSAFNAFVETLDFED